MALAFSMLVGELLFRAGIACGIKQFKHPGLYTDWKYDDDFWKWQQIWLGIWKAPPPERMHPVLGWSQAEVNAENPLGLEKTALDKMKARRPMIFFYGDSYLKGAADKEFEIPEYLAKRIPGMEVVDLGVSGYAFDQIYLLFEATHKHPFNRLTLAGVMLEDLDRSVLKVRTAQKPYYVLSDDGTPVLTGIPIERDQEKFFRENQPVIKSYFLAYLSQRYFGKFKSERKKKKDEYERALSSRLIEQMKAQCEKNKTQLVFVLFYTEEQLRRVTWQETFLKAALTTFNIPFIDTKETLLAAAKTQGVPVSYFYKAKNGHHNNFGNKLIAETTLDYLNAHELI